MIHGSLCSECRIGKNRLPRIAHPVNRANKHEPRVYLRDRKKRKQFSLAEEQTTNFSNIASQERAWGVIRWKEVISPAPQHPSFSYWAASFNVGWNSTRLLASSRIKNQTRIIPVQLSFIDSIRAFLCSNKISARLSDKMSQISNFFYTK